MALTVVLSAAKVPVVGSVRFSADGQDLTSAAAPPDGAYTVACFIRVAVDRNAFSTFWSTDAGNTTSSFVVMQTSADGATLTPDCLTGQGTVITGPVLSPLQWYKCAFVRSGANATLYAAALGSALTAYSQSDWTGAAPQTTLRIGESVWGAEWLNGNVAAFRQWDTALTLTEINAEFTQYEPVRGLNLVRFHRFAEGADLIDYSGNGNDLSATGAGAVKEQGPFVPFSNNITAYQLFDVGLAGSASVQVNAAAGLSAAATVSASATVPVSGSAPLAAAVTLTAGAVVTRAGSASLPVTAAVAGSVGSVVDATAALSVTATGAAAGGIAAMITLVKQTVGQGASSANQSITATSTGGNLLMLIYARSGGLATGAITSITDTAGNVWSVATRGAVSGATNTRIEVWVCPNAAAITSLTVNSGTAQTNAWNVLEWSGAASASPVDVASPDGSGQASSTTVTTVAVTTTNAADMVVAGFHSSQITTSGLTAGWTALTDFDDGTAGSGRAAYQLQAATGTVGAVSWTLSSAKNAGLVTVALLPGAATGVSAQAALPVTTALTAGAAVVRPAGAALAASVTLAAAAAVTRSAAAALPIGVTLTADAAVTRSGAAALPTAVALAADASVAGAASAALPVTATTAGSATSVRPATAALPVAATLTGSATVTRAAAASLGVTATTSASATGVTSVSASLPVTAALNAATGAQTIPATATVDVTATTTSSAARAVPATAAATVTANTTAAATVTRSVSAALTTTVTTSVTSSAVLPAAATLGVTATTAATSGRVASATSSATYTAIVLADATVTTAGGGAVSGPARVRFTPVRQSVRATATATATTTASGGRVSSTPSPARVSVTTAPGRVDG